MKVLLSFTGFHDPFAPSGTTGEMRAGPVLTVVAERAFDRVYLFTTPKAAEISEKTATAINERHPSVKVEILEVPLKDPTNYLGILRQLRSHFKMLNASHPDAAYSISVSSGTPHMHACWLLIAASGESSPRFSSSRQVPHTHCSPRSSRSMKPLLTSAGRRLRARSSARC